VPSRIGFGPSKITFWALGLIPMLHRTSPFLRLQRLQEDAKQAYEGATCETSRGHMEACLISFFCHLLSSHSRGYKAWATTGLGLVTLSQWRGSFPVMACHLSSSY